MDSVKCFECDVSMTKKHGNITINREGYGEYEVIGVIHFGCEKCGNKIVPPGEAKRIEELGIELHIIKVLEKEEHSSFLNLKEQLRCEEQALKEVLTKLNKNKTIKLSNSARFPVISLIKKEEKKTNLWEKIINIFK